MKEFGLKQMWRSPNGTIRNILDGTIFREPIVCRNVPRIVSHWDKPVVVARHGFGDQYRAQDFTFPGAGSLKLVFTPADGGAPIEREIIKAPGAGIALGMFNLDSSIAGFARACFNYALGRSYPVYLSTKNTILKAYDGRFKNLFQEIFDAEFKTAFEAKGLTYEHRLIDDMVAANLKWARRLPVGVQELRWRRAVRHGGAGLWVTGADDVGADVAGRQDGGGRGGARDGDAALPDAPAGQADVDEPDCVDLRLDARVAAARQDGRDAGCGGVRPDAGEGVRGTWWSQGKMTKDLAILIAPDHPFLTTEAFMDAIDAELKRQLA